MRLGQAVCDYVSLISDSEVRLCIVPLTEADYRRVLEKVNELIAPDNLAGAALRDRAQSHEILVRAIREENDLTERVFTDTPGENGNSPMTAVENLLESLEVADVDELIDRYNEMMEKSSPSLDGIPADEIENVKKALQTMDWNALSGRSWYALKRFLGTIMPTPLMDNFVGFTSTNSLTTTSESDESTSTVSPSSSKSDAKSATSQ